MRIKAIIICLVLVTGNLALSQNEPVKCVVSYTGNKKTIVSYDLHGNELSLIKTSVEFGDTIHDYKYEYDTDGELIKIIRGRFINDIWKEVEILLFYNSNGAQICEIINKGGSSDTVIFHVPGVSPMLFPDVTERLIEYKNENIIFRADMIDQDTSEFRKYEYDENDNKIKLEIFRDGDLVSQVFREFDQLNNLTYEKHFDATGKLSFECHWIYDEVNDLIRKHGVNGSHHFDRKYERIACP
ncbi:MAG: hypothetical protein QNK23_09335 [Crocinitomicaceae bacterium]|nr:hypothetical protein [Crocinitomicaceae bacterium]